MAQGGSTLQNIYSVSFPGSSLFEVSLVKDNSPELPFYKPRYFCFISITPGVKTPEGNRTFDKTRKITLKTDAKGLFALAHSLRAYANNQKPDACQYAIMADSSRSSYGNNGQNNFKTCFAGTYTPQQQGNNSKRYVSIAFKSGQNQPIGVQWLPPEGKAVADIIEKIANKCFECDFNDRSVSVGNISQPPQHQSYNTPDNSGPFSNSNDNNDGYSQQSNNYQQQPNQNQVPPPPAPNNGMQNVANNFQNAMESTVDSNQSGAPYSNVPPFMEQ